MNNAFHDSKGKTNILAEEVYQGSLLPRSAWNSQVAFLKAVFKAKKSLDRIEK